MGMLPVAYIRQPYSKHREMARAHVVIPFSGNNSLIVPEDIVDQFPASLIVFDNGNRNEKERVGQVLKYHSLPERC
jgi:hypothetical protein